MKRGNAGMMIVDAINNASNEHAIFFLVTAYIESLHHFHRSLGVPETVVSLPVAGVDDLRERLETLRNNTKVVSHTVMPAAEVSAVLATAVQRLGGDTRPPAGSR